MKCTVLAAMVVVSVAGLLNATAARILADESKKPAPGIYVSNSGKTGAEEFTRIPGARPEQVKTTGLAKMIATQGLLRGSMVVKLAGPIADFRITDPSPVFVVSLPDGTAAPPSTPPTDPTVAFAQMSQMMSGDTMPVGAKTGADFQLVQLTLVSGDRQADMGKLGSQGGKLKNSIECDQERVAQGYYRLRPKQSLKPGEYSFFFQNSQQGAGMGAAWAFGVDAGK